MRRVTFWEKVTFLVCSWPPHPRVSLLWYPPVLSDLLHPYGLINLGYLFSGLAGQRVVKCCRVCHGDSRYRELLVMSREDLEKPCSFVL